MSCPRVWGKGGNRGVTQCRCPYKPPPLGPTLDGNFLHVSPPSPVGVSFPSPLQPLSLRPPSAIFLLHLPSVFQTLWKALIYNRLLSILLVFGFVLSKNALAFILARFFEEDRTNTCSRVWKEAQFLFFRLGFWGSPPIS